MFAQAIYLLFNTIDLLKVKLLKKDMNMNKPISLVREMSFDYKDWNVKNWSVPREMHYAEHNLHRRKKQN